MTEQDKPTSLIPDDPDQLMTPTEVADIFRVHPKTVNRWAADGRLRRVRTPGGQSRYRAGDVRDLFDVERGGAG